MASPILVCGSNYARQYCLAAAAAPDRYRTAGVLARGSAASRALASRWGVPFYDRVEDVPAHLPFACAAMGRAGHEALLQLVERGVHVLAEHPIPRAIVDRALAIAHGRGSCFHVNAHFSQLSAPRRFIDACRDRARLSAPIQIEVTAADRALYGVLDLLAEAVGVAGLDGLTEMGHRGRFTTVAGGLGASDVVFQIQSGDGSGAPLPDGSTGYLVDGHVRAHFEEGALTLASFAGPVYWHPNPRHGADRRRPLWSRLDGDAPTPQEFASDRVQANVRAMDALIGEAVGGTCPASQQSDHLLALAGTAEAIGQLLR